MHPTRDLQILDWLSLSAPLIGAMFPINISTLQPIPPSLGPDHPRSEAPGGEAMRVLEDFGQSGLDFHTLDSK